MRVSIPYLRGYSIDEFGYVVREDTYLFKVIKPDQNGLLILKCGAMYFLYNYKELYDSALNNTILEPMARVNFSDLKKVSKKISTIYKKTEEDVNATKLTIERRDALIAEILKNGKDPEEALKIVYSNTEEVEVC